MAAPDSNRRVIIRVEPRVQTQLHLLIFKGFDTSQNTTAQKYSLGDLDVFPDLVLSIVCLKLDIMSALRFSQTSHGPRKFIAHILEFRRVREHATETLFALLGTRLAKHFTIFDLYSVLCSGDCATCGLSGGFVFLPTLKRTCMHCATKSSTTDIVSLNALSNYHS
ncbi:hypothetical protein B0O99DRAFT_606330 [Bisporella sp. PMI_857]|nr:hypothetical protein B0O99DRAFT_606330 [Bisporella sp. PMI_857]